MSFNTIKDFTHQQSLQELWPFFKDASQALEVKKSKAIPAGQNGIFGLVQKGLVISIIEHKSKVICIDIFKEGDYLINLAFTNVQSSANNMLVCIEDSIIHTLNRKVFDTLIWAQPKLNNPARMVFEHFYVNLKRRLLASYSQSPGKQYELLLKKKPELIQRIPKKYLASYLNISPEALSRIRNKLKSTSDD